MIFRWTLVVALSVLALMGCGPSQPNGEVAEMTLTPIDPGLQKFVQLAKEDLAQRLAIAVDEIELIEAKAVVWPDSSMGCPQPGMAYLQVPEDGALIVLQAQGNKYEYHNGGSRGLFLCELRFKNETPPPQIDIFNLTPRSANPGATTPDNSIPPGEDQ